MGKKVGSFHWNSQKAISTGLEAMAQDSGVALRIRAKPKQTSPENAQNNVSTICLPDGTKLNALQGKIIESRLFKLSFSSTHHIWQYKQNSLNLWKMWSIIKRKSDQ